ncbi:cupin domain-containing protein, partial [Salmonella enterica]|uniref:cupin domain-containing protein n=1 Tax=Salmonella enterica TaxID=28901 RepID=UPI0030ADDDDB
IMRPGDFIITPNWEWHDHGNESDGPMIWLDGLDIPIVQFFEAGFSEPGVEKAQPLTRPDDFALTAFGNALVPVDWEAKGVCSPMLNYPYRRTRE